MIVAVDLTAVAITSDVSDVMTRSNVLPRSWVELDMLYKASSLQQIGQVHCVSASRVAISRVKVTTHDSLGRVGCGDEQHLPNIIQEGAEVGRWR